jgi:hypothetical protein
MRVVRGSGKWHDIVGILSSVGLWGFTHLNWLNWQVRYRHREERICESGHWIYQDFAYGLDYRWKGNFAYGWIFAETYTSSWQHWL